MATKQRLDLSPATFGFAAAAALNMAAVAAVVVAGASVQATGYADGIGEAFRSGLAAKADAEAARLATGVVPYALNGPMIPVQAARLAPPGARYELAGEFGGQWRVIAASNAARIGQAPDAALAGAIDAPAPAGTFTDGPAGAGDVRYTAFYHVPMLPAGRSVQGDLVSPKATAKAPAPVASPKPAPAKAAFAKASAAKPTGGTHRVRWGDTLFQISRAYYGTDSQFEAIYRLNREAIGPDRSNLPVGANLRLPPGYKMPASAEPAKATSKAAARPQPAASAMPKVPPRPAALRPTHAPRQLALMLTIAGQAPATDPRAAREAAMPLAATAAGVTGVCWLFGGWLLVTKRRRRLDEQRDRFLAGIDARMRARGPAFDASLLQSPWQIEQATAILDAPEPGGAFAEVLALSDTKLGIFVGDATGSSANAMLSRGLAVATWRACARVGATPGETLLALNRLMADQVPQGDHVTAFYAQLDLLSGAVAYASASHAGAYVLSADGRTTLLGGRGMPLGIGQELFAGRLEGGVARLQEGESLWVFTDGLVKLENAQGEPFGLERIERCLQAAPGLSPDRQLAAVEAALAAFTGQRARGDDAALACVRLAHRVESPTRSDALPALEA